MTLHYAWSATLAGSRTSAIASLQAGAPLFEQGDARGNSSGLRQNDSIRPRMFAMRQYETPRRFGQARILP